MRQAAVDPLIMAAEIDNAARVRRITLRPGGDGLVLHGFTLARISRDAQIVARAQRPLIIQARLGLTDGFARIVLLATWRLTRVVTPFAV